MVLSEITAALSLLKTGTEAGSSAFELAKKIKAAFKEEYPDISALRELIIDLEDKQLTAREANIDLRKQLLEIEEAAKMEDEFNRYELFETEGGAKVYKIREDAGGDEISHFICPNCREDGTKSILQPGTPYFMLNCPSCGTNFKTKTREYHC